jgi:hypothetical protein
LFSLGLNSRNLKIQGKGTCLLEIRIRTIQLNVFRAINQPATMLNNLLETNTRPNRSADSPLRPRRINHLVSLARILRDLLDASCTTALDGDQLRHSRKKLLVLQICETELHRLLDQPVEFEEVVGGVDVWDSAVVAHEVEVIGRDGLGGHEALWGNGVSSCFAVTSATASVTCDARGYWHGVNEAE